jgi:phosphoribosylamine--glycine ligase
MKMKVLVIGGGARENAICKSVYRARNSLYSVMKNKNPGIARICDEYLLEKETNVKKVAEYAEEKAIDLAIIGPEAPEEVGLADELLKRGIATASPQKKAAEIETNKEFMRWLMDKYDIPGSIKYGVFSDVRKAEEFIQSLDGNVAVKPIGLTGGKGVRVQGDHFQGANGAIDRAKEVIKNKIGGKSRVLIEEKLEGEEFTIQAFCDGSTIASLPAVQDHKRLLPGDKGVNTGGMGSYSCPNGLLPFLKKEEYEESVAIMKKIVGSLAMEGRKYIGAIYGQFMLTSSGPKVVEINARWGDPEAMNVLPLLKSNFVNLCMAMVDERLAEKKLEIDKKATVCKYVVPEGYGVQPKEGEIIEVDEKGIKREGGNLFYASVNEFGDKIYTTKSRSLAIVGISDTIAKAESICERSLANIKGKVFIRHDIGTEPLIESRIGHMEKLRKNKFRKNE